MVHQYLKTCLNSMVGTHEHFHLVGTMTTTWCSCKYFNLAYARWNYINVLTDLMKIKCSVIWFILMVKVVHIFFEKVMGSSLYHEFEVLIYVYNLFPFLWRQVPRVVMHELGLGLFRYWLWTSITSFVLDILFFMDIPSPWIFRN